MTRIPMWLGALVLAFGMAACATENESDAGKTSTEEAGDTSADDAPKWSEDDIEYKLASIDAGEPVDVDDERIADYAKALKRAERKCKEDRTKIADMAVVTVQQLDEQLPGHEENSLTMIRAANTSLEALEGKTPCADIFATLVVLMTS